MGFYGIVANINKDRILRNGAKIWVLRCNGDAERPVVRGMSLGGRYVTKYANYNRITNYRAKWFHESAYEKHHFKFAYREKEEASKVCDFLNKRFTKTRA